MTGHPQGFSRRSRRDRSTGAMTCCPTRGNLPWERGGAGRTGRGASRQPSHPGAPDTQTMSNLIIVIGIGLCMRLLQSATPGSSARPCFLPLPASSIPPGRTLGSRRKRPGGLWPRGTLVHTRAPTTTTERHVVPMPYIVVVMVDSRAVAEAGIEIFG